MGWLGLPCLCILGGGVRLGVEGMEMSILDKPCEGAAMEIR